MTPIHMNDLTKSYFTKPELLLHSNIPGGLAGLNPRGVRGKDWWDAVRKTAEKGNNYCCWACGTHKSSTPEHWLEGHETYELDDDNYIAHYVGTVSLCKKCHMYIHSGRLLRLLIDKAITHEEYLDVYEHGVKVLSTVGLQPTAVQYFHFWRGAGFLQFGPLGERALAITQAWPPEVREDIHAVELQVARMVIRGDSQISWELVEGGKTYTHKDIQDTD